MFGEMSETPKSMNEKDRNRFISSIDLRKQNRTTADPTVATQIRNMRTPAPVIAARPLPPSNAPRWTWPANMRTNSAGPAPRV